MDRDITQAAIRLVAWRERRGLSQFAVASQLGVDTSHYAKFEKGKRKPGRSLAARIEKITDGTVRVGDWDEPAGAMETTSQPAVKAS